MSMHERLNAMQGAGDRRALLAGIGGLAAGALLSQRAVAGPINPPAGPIAGTHKTLGDIEPRIPINSANTPGDSLNLFRIAQPGSYYLTENINGVSGRGGIVVAADGVTIDLNGFALRGVPGSRGGIQSEGGAGGLVVRNGTIARWGWSGIFLLGTSPAQTLVENIISESNSEHGIVLRAGGVARNCIVRRNAMFGLLAFEGSSIRSCLAFENALCGILVQAGSTVCDCTSSGDMVGVESSGGSTIARCTVSASQSHGIIAGAGSTIVNCAVNQSTRQGIRAGVGCTVAECAAFQCTEEGVHCDSDCVVLRCNCVLNGGTSLAGIHLAGSGCRVEACNSTRNGVGMRAASGGNILVRNICSGNTTNWNLASGNRILVVNSTAAGVVSGNLGGANPGSTNPWANFTY